MKYLVLLLIAFAFSFSACKTRNGNKEDATPSLNAEQTAFLASMFAKIDSLNAVHPLPEGNIYLRIAQLKHCTISPLPVYYLDKKRFLVNPTPENLLQSLYQPANVKAFLAEERAWSIIPTCVTVKGYIWTTMVLSSTLKNFAKKFPAFSSI